jgi:hypothetical protein
MQARAFRDEGFADVDCGALASVAGVGLESESEHGNYFAIEGVK